MKENDILRGANNLTELWLAISQVAELKKQKDKDDVWTKDVVIDWGEEYLVNPDYYRYDKYLQ